MSFIQIIECRTIKLDELKATLDGWLEATKGKRAATRGVQTKDRDTVDTYVQIVEFPSYEEALANSNLSETSEFAVSAVPVTRVARVDRGVLVVLAGAALVAWLAVFGGFDGEGAGIAGFVAAWTVMMVAMMVPSATPFVLLYRRGATPAATARLTAGYLAVWGGVGVAAWALHEVAIDVPVAAVLGVAGVYQLTPAKHACLRRCRTPADFLVERWRANAFLLGADHGRWCIGCCWALMAVLVVAGMMGIVWVAAIAAIVALEKLSSHGAGLARWTGLSLIALSVWEGVS